MPSRGPERRRSTRLRADLILELYEPDGKLIVGVGRLLDLSEHGVHFESTLALNEGQKIHVLLRLDEKLLLEIPSCIVRVRSKMAIHTYGAEFIDQSAYTLEKLKEWSKRFPGRAHS